MATKKLWGGRFSSDADPLFTEFNDSLPFDRELLAADIEGSIAYARALERAGIFSARERKQVEGSLRDLMREHEERPELIRESRLEDVHTYVEDALQRRVGNLALRLHTGRSRNDQVATDLRLYVRKQASRLEEQLNLLLQTIAERAESGIGQILPGYTHLQRAQPVVWSHYLLAFGEMMLRDRDRLRSAARRANVSPLGSGALSGTVYKIDRETLARDLGFYGVTENSMDAVSDRDFVLELLFFAGTLQMHLSRLAEDLILYNSAEFGFVQMDDSVASGSSLMPQKKNPDALELIRGKTGRVYGHLMALLTVMKGLPMTYNKDMQEDKEGLFDAVRTVENSLKMTRLVLERIQLRPERMLQAARSGYLNATEVADYLVSKGVPFREAHEIVGKLVVHASQMDVALEQLSLADYRRFSPLFDQGVYGVLDMGKTVARRAERGGASPAQVRTALRRFRKRIAAIPGREYG